MKKIIKYIFLPLLLIIFAGGCNEDPSYYEIEAPVDQMKITASAENVVLQKIDETKEAITFTWNKATDRGGNTKINYHFRLYHADDKDTQSEVIELGEDVFSMIWTTRQLNNVLYAWKVEPGNEVPIVAEVLAIVEGSSKYLMPEISLVEFTAVGYEPSNKLYLTVSIGNESRSLEMQMVDNDIFNWKGDLDPCDFWFVRNIERGAPAYMKGANENTLVYSESGEGERFTAGMTGNYDITVDLNTMELTVKSTPLVSLYLVTSLNGVEQIKVLNEIQAGTGIFSLRDDFEEGTEFRFTKEEDPTWPAYVKSEDETKLELKEEGSEMFRITKTATYEMIINMTDLTLQLTEIEKKELYLVISRNGSEQVISLDEVEFDSDIYYLKREFEAGTEFRFARSQNSTWPAYVKGADDNTLELKDQGAEMFKAGKTATYVMTVNMENLSLIFLDVYDSPTGVIGVVGDAVDGSGWDAGLSLQNSPLTQKDLINRPEVISYTGRFVYNSSPERNDDNAFKFVGAGDWGHSLFATKPWANPFDPDEQDVTLDNTDDRKFMLPAGTESGIYTLEMNLHTMKINLIKQ